MSQEKDGGGATKNNREGRGLEEVFPQVSHTKLARFSDVAYPSFKNLTDT